jgi:hypothetical protein
MDQLLWQAARRVVGLTANRPYLISLRSKPLNGFACEKSFGARISRLGTQAGLAATRLT